jgi:hypothetical protein
MQLARSATLRYGIARQPNCSLPSSALAGRAGRGHGPGLNDPRRGAECARAVGRAFDLVVSLGVRYLGAKCECLRLRVGYRLAALELAGEVGGLDAVGDAEFVQDVGDVNGCGAGADIEAVGDLAVCQANGQPVEHVAFAAGQ